jgi:hypothetical protein
MVLTPEKIASINGLLANLPNRSQGGKGVVLTEEILENIAVAAQGLSSPLPDPLPLKGERGKNANTPRLPKG